MVVLARGQSDPQATKVAPTHVGIRYGPHVRNLFDFWAASSAAPAPLLVHIHGGGFRTGSRTAIDQGLIRACLAAGIAVMSIDYRFLPDAPIQDILRDCARAIQFIRLNAETYQIDPKRVAAYGSSAGAGTSLWLGFHPDLADPHNPDPVLRQSSRLTAIAGSNTQATYNLPEWETVIGPNDPSWSRNRAPDEELAGFYHVRDIGVLETAAGRQLLAGVSMLQLASSDDPPVFLASAHPDGPIQNRSHYLHHPRHTRAVEARCREVGIPITVHFSNADPRSPGNASSGLRAFLLKHLGATPRPPSY